MWGAERGMGRGMQPEQHLYRPLFIARNQSNGKQFEYHDITRSRSQSDDGSRRGPKLSQCGNFLRDMFNASIGLMGHPFAFHCWGKIYLKSN